MNRGTLVSALFVVALITLDFTFTVAHARNTVNVYKVTKVKKSNTLRMRKWPGPKSHVKASLPFNAKNITATGKKKLVGKTKWVEIKWRDNQGWVNGNYLKKTGALIITQDKSGKQPSKSRNTASKNILKNKVSSRNSRSIKPKNKSHKQRLGSPIEMPPNEFGGDRYDQTIEESNAHEVRTSYTPNKKQNKRLSCIGSIPKPWNMKLDINDKEMKINFPGKKPLNIPLHYNDLISPNKAIMSLGGNRGRNLVVDINLEKSNSCRNGYSYEINTTINNQFYSGCCR